MDYKQHTYSVVDRIQWTGLNPYTMRAFVGMHTTGSGGSHHIFTIQNGIRNAELYVATSNSWESIRIGDWVIREKYGFRIKSRSKSHRGVRALRRRIFV